MARDIVDFLALAQQRAAEAKTFVGDNHAATRTPRRQRRHQPRGARADHQHVAMGVGFFVPVGIGQLRSPAKARRLADDRFVDFLPEAFGPHEGLVVEAGGENRGGQRSGGAHVEAERRPAVLASGHQAVVKLDRRRPRVGFKARPLAEFHQRVGFGSASRNHPARPVIFERPAHQVNAIGDQRRGQRVALVAGEAPAVELKSKRRGTVDEPALR